MRAFSEKFDRLIIIGASAGGIAAMRQLLAMLPEKLNCPIVAILHRMKNVDSKLDEVLQKFTRMPVHEISDKLPIEAGHIYVAPPNYHVHFEHGESVFSLSSDEAVNFSRPSIDVSMQSAAAFANSACLGILLTGANRDGAQGLFNLHKLGALTVIQDPEEAEVPRMPEAAMEILPLCPVLPLKLIAELIKEFDSGKIPQNEQ